MINMRPTWKKNLQEVLKHETQEVTLVSPKSGNEYQTDVIQSLKVASTGSVEETTDRKFRYSVVDTINDLEYSIKTENKVDVKFGNVLLFRVVRGGALESNAMGWFSAKSVELVKNNA